jgi:glycyl-tRNA synthetase
VVLKLAPEIAPIKVAVLPLSKKPELSKLSDEVYTKLVRSTGYNIEYDETQSIGKRYRRQDEIGTPYCVTIDFESLEDGCVTVRERDSMQQSRVKIEDLEKHLKI